MPSSRFATTAYRTDASAHQGPFGESDAAWLAVASLLEHAARLSGNARSMLVRDAADLAGQIAGEAAIHSFASEEWESESGEPAENVLVLARQIEEAGALNLAAAMLDALIQTISQNPLQTGRALAQRARVTWKLGDLDEAVARYALVERTGTRHRLPELRIRAYIGRAAIAQMRGNYPEVRQLSLRALRAAHTLKRPRLERLAAYGVIRAAAAMGNVDEALGHAWDVYMNEAANETAAAESLQSMGQLLLESGHSDAARAAFAALASRPLPARVLLPALGGLALAGAQTGRESTVEWVTREVTRLRTSAAPRYALASALLECGSAFHLLGRATEAEASRQRAIEIAKQNGFHELVYRAELEFDTAGRRAGAPVPLKERGAAVAHSITSMEPETLPEHVTLASATAT